MKRVIFAIILSVVYASAGFGQGAPPPPPQPVKKPVETTEWGSLRNGKYISERLGVSLEVPSQFTVPSLVETKVLGDAGADMLKKGVISEKRFDEAVARTIKLFALFEKPIGSPGNSGLELVAAKQPSGTTANMTLLASLALLKGSPFNLTRSLSPMKLGRNTFAAAELEGSLGEAKFKQRIYVTMHKGYALVFVNLYQTDEQKAAFEQVISSLSLN